MTERSRRNNNSANTRARVALIAIQGEETLAQLATQFDVHPNQITLWKGWLLERADTCYENKPLNKKRPPKKVAFCS